MNSKFVFLLILARICLIDGNLDPGNTCTRGDVNCRPMNRESCDLHESIQAFRQKRSIDPVQDMQIDPYSETMDENEERIRRSIIQNPRINCGVRYSDVDRDGYSLRTFPNEYETAESGFILTHYGRCGLCSSLQDLSVYLALHSNMTVLARQCAFINIASDRLSTYCFERMGFTEACSRIWMFNAKNTRRNCLWPCFKSWIFSEPNNVEENDGVETLNTCLQCDEDQSGLIFKYFAGRTRRNSGIVTDIERPTRNIRNVTHCYY